MSAITDITRRTARLFVSVLVDVRDLLTGLVGRGAAFTEHWLVGRKKALYGLAVTRILFGLLGMGMIATNWSTRYYAYGAGSAWTGEALYPGSDFAKFWPTSYFHDIGQQDVLLTASMAALFVISALLMLGWRTRVVMPLFLIGYVSWIEMNDLLSDQSDNLIRMVLIYMLVADPAGRLSLDARRRSRNRRAVVKWSAWRAHLRPYDTMLHNLAIVTMVLHVAFIYMSGALYKAQGTTWSEGYAVYNPLHVERFSVWPELADAITYWGPAVAAISWGTIIIQMMFLPMLATRITRIIALLGVLSFHIGIGVLMGLPFFSLAMIAVDSVLIRDRTWRAMGRAIRDRWRATQPVGSRSAADNPALSDELPTPAVTEDAEPVLVGAR